MGRKNSALSAGPCEWSDITRLYSRVARSSGDIWEMSGGEIRDAGGGPSSAATLPASRIPLPDEPPSRIATTVNSPAIAAPATPQARRARQPAAAAPLAWAPPLCQYLAVG